jgi:iron complex transport system substrate-binding protein
MALLPTIIYGQGTPIKDDAGNVFTLTAPPQRIVSLAPNITEILFALGLGEQIVGVTRYCDYPPAALQKEKIGGLLDQDIEKIQALAPDLIIAFRGNPLTTLKKLQSLRLPVFILDIGNNLDSVPKTIEKIARITQREKEAQDLLDSLAEKLQKTMTALDPIEARPKVFLTIDGMGLSTCGKTSYFNDLLNKAKSVNIAGRLKKQWLSYSREQLIKDNPDIIIVLEKSKEDFQKAREAFMEQAGFQSIKAVRTGRIHFLDENIASRFGPRLYDAFVELARLIHPEINLEGKTPSNGRRT